MDSEQQNNEWRRGAEEYERERRRMEGMEKEAKQRAVIAGLTEDFACVNYVDLTTEAYENTTIFRISDKLSSIIPGWATERNSRERFRLFSQYAVYEPDRERFIERTSQSLVLLHLQKYPAYFVNFRIRNGEDYSYTQMKFTADYAADRTIKGLVIGIHSIDEVKRHEEQRAEYMTVIASLADDFEFVGIIDKNLGDLTIYRASPVFEKALEASKDGKIIDSQLGRLLRKMVVEEDQEEFNRKNGREIILKALERDSVYKFEVRLMIDGQAQYYRIKFTQDKDNPDKLVVGLLNIDRQVRNEIAVGELEKELEYQNELKEARDRAEAASRAKSAFLFNMSHDVRTPMNAIIGFTDIAQKHIDDHEKVADSLHKIKSSSAHLLSLLNDVLDMSRIENGHVEITETPVDLIGFMDDIAPIVTPLAKAKNIGYNVTYGEIRDRYVQADILHINQVVINLVTNAIKYTGEGGRVTLKLEQEKDVQDGIGMYSIMVEDTGIGMSKEFMNHMFESFVRENREEVMKEQGAGLGLAITNRLVTLMNGTITAKSEIGKGSTFVVTLPLKIQQKSVSKTQAEDSANESKTLEGRKILLVDDNELNCEIAAEILRESGMVVDMACNGVEAVEMVKKNGVHYYDAILMDIRMPVMNGYEAASAIRALPDDGRPVVIIALSANAFEEDKQKSLAVGMDAHIAKPVKSAVLLDTLRKFI
ncbi:MAG: response regulator [Victivallales bacterium]|nr:response regulator [Victivallales bacterium]